MQVFFSPHSSDEYHVQVRASVNLYTFTANLSGTGGRAVFEPASNPTDFGVAAVGSAGATREITVSNVGNAPGGLFIAVVSGGAVGSYQLLDENCTGHELRPAATCTLQVRFQPLGEGVKTATLSLFGDGDGGTQIVLTGVGAAPGVAAGASAPAVSSLAPRSSAGREQRLRKPKLRIQRGHRRAGLADRRFVARVR